MANPSPTTPTFSANPVEFGQSVTISTQNATAGTPARDLRHKMSYSFKGNTGNLNSGNYIGVNTTYAWTVPDMSSSLQNEASGVCTITCITYDLTFGTTELVGTRTVDITLKVADSTKPAISSVTVAEAVTSPDIKTKFNAYIQSKSKAKVTIAATGTSLTYQTNIDGVNYSGSTITSNALNISGSRTITVTVTDKWGRTASTTRSISVLAYTPPQITSFSAWRADSSGNRNNSGEYIRTTFAGSVASVNNLNDKQWALQYKVTNSGAYANTANPTTPSGYSFSQTNYNVTRPSGGYSALTSYYLKLVVSDFFASVERIVTIPTQTVMLDFNDNGNGIGIGMINQNSNAIDSAWAYNGTGMNLTGSAYLTNGGTFVSKRTDYNSATVPASGENMWMNVVNGRDSDNENRVYVGQYALSSGTQGMQLAFRRIISNEALTNDLRLQITSSGSKTVWMSDPDAWRSALGLGTMATESASSYLPLTGGTLSGNLFIEDGSYIREKSDTASYWAIQVYNANNLSRAVAAVGSSNNWYFPEFVTAGGNREDYALPTPTNSSSTTKAYNIVTDKLFRCGTLDQQTVNANTRMERVISLGYYYTSKPVVVVTLTSTGNSALFGSCSCHIKDYVQDSNGRYYAVDVEVSNAGTVNRGLGLSWMAFATS